MIQERLKKVEDIKHSVELNKVSLKLQCTVYVSSADTDNHPIMLDTNIGKPD